MWKIGVVAAVVAGTAWGQVTQRVSLSSSGVQGDSGSVFPALSSDGRYVGFTSLASNLVAGDGNDVYDAFVRDRVSGTTERVSVTSSGAETYGFDGAYGYVSISADGRYVAFESDATNLAAGDTNSRYDVFVHDRLTGTTEWISVGSGGAAGNGMSGSPAISGDGRHVLFRSDSSNLVAGDTNGRPDVFVRDRLSGTTERVSVGSGGAQGNGDSFAGSISADGRYVAFASDASNMVAGDTNATEDVFVRDRLAGTTERASVDSSGVEGDLLSTGPRISSDGRYVVFESFATNLVAGDTNGVHDTFVRDRVLGTTERVSVATGGAQANGGSYFCSISGDGRYVVFESSATNLVAGDTNGFTDVFVRDRLAGTTRRVSVDTSGSQGNSASNAWSISDDGRYVALWSFASNLVVGDTNGWPDAFIHDLKPARFTSLCDPGVDGVIGCPCSNPPADFGRGCENSAATGGAVLSASGATSLASDSLVFTTSAERPTALSVVFQGTTSVPNGLVYGQGVRCAGGALKRLFSKNASGGSLTAPDVGAGEPTVSARSAAKGDPISPGETRTYFVAYRDPIVLGGCPASSTFNATQTGQVSWSP